MTEQELYRQWLALYDIQQTLLAMQANIKEHIENEQSKRNFREVTHLNGRLQSTKEILNIVTRDMKKYSDQKNALANRRFWNYRLSSIILDDIGESIDTIDYDYDQLFQDYPNALEAYQVMQSSWDYGSPGEND